jgi:hypothetical protein
VGEVDEEEEHWDQPIGEAVGLEYQASWRKNWTMMTLPLERKQPSFVVIRT